MRRVGAPRGVTQADFRIRSQRDQALKKSVPSRFVDAAIKRTIEGRGNVEAHEHIARDGGDSIAAAAFAGHEHLRFKPTIFAAAARISGVSRSWGSAVALTNEPISMRYRKEDRFCNNRKNSG